jgi:hypothetical protein
MVVGLAWAGAGCGGDSAPVDGGVEVAGDVGVDDGRDVPVADSAEIPPTADPRPRIFVPRVVPDAPGGGIWDHKQRMAIFWFGRVDRRNDYVQCRAGYDDALLMMQCAVFDREIYDEAPDAASVVEWDALQLYLDLDGDPAKTAIDDRSFRIDVQAGRHGTAQAAAYRGAGGAWVDAGLPLGDDFGATPDRICVGKGYRGEERDQSRGWHVNWFVPWSALGLAGPPGAGERLWNVALTALDRDSLDGALRGQPQHWPGAGFDDGDPSSWGTWELLDGRFLGREESGAVAGSGRPAYAVAHEPAAYAAGTEETITIRQGVETDVVDNAAVGASETLCSGDDDYNFGDGAGSWGGNVGREYFHVQDQEDYADWPCFARIYLKFPLGRVPAGRVVVGATLRLHHSMPTSGGDEGSWSLLQAFRVAPVLRDGMTPWDATNLTWNDAPLAMENCAGFWGDRTGMMETGWDALPAWEWDVGRAVAQAVAEGATHAAFALYSADSEYHTGKQFVQSSDFPDWGDPTQRPALEVVVAEPE